MPREILNLAGTGLSYRLLDSGNAVVTQQLERLPQMDETDVIYNSGLQVIEDMIGLLIEADVDIELIERNGIVGNAIQRLRERTGFHDTGR